MMRTWLVVALVAAFCQISIACTCRPQHPQTQFCKSDFVILARVRKMVNTDEFYNTYQVKIRSIYKQSPKAEVALRSGLLRTPTEDSLCGVTLRPQETYIITGRVIYLEAHINLCSFVSRLHDVTPRQRKGFRRLYERSCKCVVKRHRSLSQARDVCVTHDNECYERNGICMGGNRTRCHWANAPALTKCLKKQRHNGTYITPQAHNFV